MPELTHWKPIARLNSLKTGGLLAIFTSVSLGSLMLAPDAYVFGRANYPGVKWVVMAIGCLFILIVLGYALRCRGGVAIGFDGVRIVAVHSLGSTSIDLAEITDLYLGVNTIEFQTGDGKIQRIGTYLLDREAEEVVAMIQRLRDTSGDLARTHR